MKKKNNNHRLNPRFRRSELELRQEATRPTEEPVSVGLLFESDASLHLCVRVQRSCSSHTGEEFKHSPGKPSKGRAGKVPGRCRDVISLKAARVNTVREQDLTGDRTPMGPVFVLDLVLLSSREQNETERPSRGQTRFRITDWDERRGRKKPHCLV